MLGKVAYRNRLRIGFSCAVLQHGEYFPRFGQLFCAGAGAERAEHERVAHHLRDFPTGISVVADIRYAGRRQILAADSHEPLANLRGNPTVDAVRDDVVELAEIRGDVCQAHGEQLDIAQPEPLDDLAAFRHLCRG